MSLVKRHKPPRVWYPAEPVLFRPVSIATHHKRKRAMAKPTLHIELDPGPWAERDLLNHRVVGGTVSGRLRMTADEMIKCRKLTVAIGWHTEGTGDTDSETVFETTVHEGEIYPGDQEFPFSCDLPDGPISYAGHLINVIWSVSARLDLAWKRDPTAEQPFFLSLP